MKQKGKIHKNIRCNPPQIILASFLLLILAGTLLLNLPMSSRTGHSIGFLDALFTATSAVCVTGLTVVSTQAHWSLFGQIIILILIQVGALGFMTLMTYGMIAFRRQISLKDQLLIQTTYNQNTLGGMIKLVKKVVVYTFAIESLGAVLLTLAFLVSEPVGFAKALFKGVFHAVSAFCNAGFDIMGDNSLIPYSSNIPVLVIMMGLIIAGGLGFTVLAELHEFVINPKRQSARIRLIRLSLHSKIALTVTGALTLIGMILFMLLEWTNPKTLDSLSVFGKAGAALFQSVTLRTAGFAALDQGGLTEASKFVSCLYMLVGGSPGGTAGGIKTVTLGVILIAMLSVLKGNNRIEAFGRTLPLNLLQKALTVVGTMFIVVVVSTMLLYFTEKGNPFVPTFLDLLFESSSAAGTVGLTTGVTAFLSVPGKILIILCMFLGRLSPVAVVVALNMKSNNEKNAAGYIEEHVIIG